MTNLIINVEIKVGTGVTQAIHDLIGLAKKLNCTVTSKFNDYDLWVNPNSDPNDLIDAWNQYYLKAHHE